MVAAIQNGAVTPLRAVPKAQSHQFRDDSRRFAIAVCAGNHLDFLPLSQGAPELFREEMGIVGNQCVGSREDPIRRAIVPLQLDDIEAGEVLLEP